MGGPPPDDDATPGPDLDPREFDPETAKTTATGVPLDAVIDGAVPVPVEADTPRPENTGRHRMTPAMFASAVDLADRDAYARGLAHGRAAAVADAEEAAVTELRRVREDGVEAFRSFYVIWNGKWPATWEEAEAWYRSRLSPL